MTTGAGTGSRLVLLRHAKSAWPDMPDHERPLARRGRRDAPVMGRWLRAARLVPDLVLCSTARRARETWQLAQSGLGAAPPVLFDDRVYEASAASLLDLIRRQSGAARTLLVVGHDPAVPGLALTLAGADPDGQAGAGSGAVPAGTLDRMRAKFPTAAIAVFGCAGTWDGLGLGPAWLVCFITPRDLPGSRRR
jgi:phosphohistidine phosphatase